MSGDWGIALKVLGDALGGGARAAQDARARETEEEERRRRMEMEERAQAFYERMSERRDTREEASHEVGLKLSGAELKSREAELKDIEQRLSAEADFMEKNGMTFQAWQLMGEKQKFDAYLRAQEVSIQASQMSSMLAGENLRQMRELFPMELAERQDAREVARMRLEEEVAGAPMRREQRGIELDTSRANLQMLQKELEEYESTAGFRMRPETAAVQRELQDTVATLDALQKLQENAMVTTMRPQPELDQLIKQNTERLGHVYQRYNTLRVEEDPFYKGVIVPQVAQREQEAEAAAAAARQAEDEAADRRRSRQQQLRNTNFGGGIQLGR